MGKRWRETRAVFAEELTRGARRAGYRIVTIAVPVILLVLVIAVPLVSKLLSGDSEGEPGRFGLVDRSGLVTAMAGEDAGFQAYADRGAGLAALMADEVTSLFVVREDYVATGGVEWLHKGTGIAAAVPGESAAGRLSSLLRAGLLEGRLGQQATTRFLAPAAFVSVVVDAEGGASEGAAGVELLSISYAFAVLLMLSILTSSGYLLESVAEEKENRMIEVLLTSVSPFGLMAGKVLAMGALGLIQAVVWGVSMVVLAPRIVAGLPGLEQIEVEPGLIPWVAAFFLAGYFLMAVILAGIGAVTTSYRESSQIAAIVYLPAIVPMVVFQLIGGNPDGPLARVLSFVPVTAPLTMMLRLGAADVPVVEALASLATVVLAGVVLLFGSVRVFRAGMLLYGQRMTLRRVFQALREAG